MTDELLERYDRLTDYVEEVWDSAPYSLKIPALAVFWVGVVFGARNAVLLTKRYPTLDDIPSTYFQRQLSVAVRVHRVHPSYHLQVSHKPLFRPAWRPSASSTSEDFMKNTFLVRVAGCRPLGFENKAMNAEKNAFIESQVLNRTISLKLLAREPAAAAALAGTGLFRWRTLNAQLVEDGWAMYEPSKLTEAESRQWVGWETAARDAGRGLWGSLRHQRRR
eukprot:EG_transcript_23651